ncbi:MAG: EAL domain-containing protein [Pseudohongiellaceae bacterium]|nr:EAL domain-containing protein [Pseudohongiellaceae bacterium]
MDVESKVIFAPEVPNVYPESDENFKWRILVVDDDEEVHQVTQLAIARLRINNIGLQLHHVHSAKECIEFLKEYRDVAVLLLDVVMETPTAGLDCIPQIRQELGLSEMRIVLRTGQPGYAPEEKVIRDYDINDYRAKTELNHNNFRTLITSAVRSYQQIRNINQNRLGLQKIINAGTNLLEQNTLRDFADGVITQIAALLDLKPEGVVCSSSYSSDKTVKEAFVVGAGGKYAQYIRSPLTDLDDKTVQRLINLCLEQEHHLYTDKATILYLADAKEPAAVYLQTAREIAESDKQLLNVFVKNISASFENVKLFQSLRHIAYIDPLTQLPNRNEFTRALEQVSDNPDVNHVALLIDIDHFSDINSGLGHEIGNELLIAVANRLKMSFGDDGIVARVDADVFGVIGEEYALTPQKALAVFESPFNAEEQVLTLNATVGIGRVTSLGEHGIDKLKRLYIALNSAKKLPSRSFDYYSDSMEQETEKRLQLIRQLRVDFALQKLRIWYQPQYDIETRKIVSLEALLRWPQDDNSFIPPNVFIPIAEYSGLIVSIGAWVLEQACAQLAQFRSANIGGISIAVNVSMPQFRSPLFLPQVAGALKRYNIKPGELELEITESILMDEPEIVINCLNKLKTLGVHISIDDFGTGYSSLNYLRRLPLDKIKVDRSFVKDLHTPGGAAVAETIVHLGTQLGLLTIAEGIETEEQEAALARMGCVEAQGYLFAKPMPLEELSNILLKKSPDHKD